MKSSKRNINLCMIFIVSFLLFMSPQLLRTANGECSIIGYPTYYHARIGDLIKEGTFYDPLSFQGRSISYQLPFPLLISLISLITGSGTSTCFFLGPLLGALTILFLALILEKWKIKPYLALLFPLIPIGLYTFSHCNSRALPYLLGIIGFYFLIKKQNKLFIIFITLSTYSHFLTGFIFIAFCSLFILAEKRKIRLIFYLAFFSILVITPHFMINGLPQKNLLHQEYLSMDKSSLNYSSFDQLIMYNNPLAAIDPIIFTLTIIYLVKRKDWFLRFSTLFVLIISILAERFRIFLAFPLSIAAAKLLNKSRYSLLIVILILPFTIAAAFAISGMGPDNCFCQTMGYIKEKTPQNTTLLTSWNQGHWAELLSQRKVIIDGYAEYVSDIDDRYIAMRTIYCSKDPSIISYYINKYNISYIIEDSHYQCNGIYKDITKPNHDSCITIYEP